MVLSYVGDTRSVMKGEGASWLLVFYHNSASGEYFTSIEEALDSHTPRKFSIIGSINTKFLIRGKYEFLLDVPGFAGFNRWRQKLHPKDTTNATNSETNEYEPVKLSWTTYFKGGLAKSSAPTFTFFDCSADLGNWWYPIGARRYHTVSNTMPIHMDKEYQGPEIRLWIRIPPRSISCRCKCNKNRLNFYVMILLILSN